MIIAPNGLEFWDDGTLVDSYRNWKIGHLRENLPPRLAEKNVAEWIVHHDGEDTRPKNDA